MKNPVQIARFSDARETREIYLAERCGGGAAILQYSWGELTQLSYGSSAICQTLVLDEQGIMALAGRLGWADGIRAGLLRFFADGDVMLSELLDICSASAIPHQFNVMGGDGQDIGSSWAVCERRRTGFSLVP